MIRFKAKGWEAEQFIKRRWGKIPDEEKFVPLLDGIQKVMTGEYAYHSNPDTVYSIINKYFDANMVCAMTEVHISNTKTAMWVTHHGPFTELIRIG